MHKKIFVTKNITSELPIQFHEISVVELHNYVLGMKIWSSTFSITASILEPTGSIFLRHMLLLPISDEFESTNFVWASLSSLEWQHVKQSCKWESKFYNIQTRKF